MGGSLGAAALLAAVPAVFARGVPAFPLGRADPVPGTSAAATAGVLAALAVAAALLGRARREAVPALGAALTGLLLLAALLAAPGDRDRGTRCPDGESVRYLATLPKDAVIAGDPFDLKCLPGTARRAVVISTQLAPSYELDYLLAGRARMFETLLAYYGSSAQPIADLRTRYGATHLWVRRAAVAAELTTRGARWRAGRLPYGRFVRDLVRAGTPAVLRLPSACRRWSHGTDEVYDIGCIAGGG